MSNHYGDSKAEQREVFESGRGRIPPVSVHKLGMAEQYKLMQFVETNYVVASVNDEDFAALAEKKLGFKITKFNISGVRKALNLESTLDRLSRERKARQATEPQTRLDKIEARVLELEMRLKSLCDQLGVK